MAGQHGASEVRLFPIRLGLLVYPLTETTAGPGVDASARGHYVRVGELELRSMVFGAIGNRDSRKQCPDTAPQPSPILSRRGHGKPSVSSHRCLESVADEAIVPEASHFRRLNGRRSPLATSSSTRSRTWRVLRECRAMCIAPTGNSTPSRCAISLGRRLRWTLSGKSIPSTTAPSNRPSFSMSSRM